MSRKFSLDELGVYFSSFKTYAFRLEALDLYTAPYEEPEYVRFLAGERDLPQVNAEWTDLIRANLSAGKTMSRVHAVTLPLSPYVQFEIACGYNYSDDAGEKIKLVDKRLLSPAITSLGDFWLFDWAMVIRMVYDSECRLLGGYLEEDREIVAPYIEASKQLEDISTPLSLFLSENQDKGE